MTIPLPASDEFTSCERQLWTYRLAYRWLNLRVRYYAADEGYISCAKLFGTDACGAQNLARIINGARFRKLFPHVRPCGSSRIESLDGRIISADSLIDLFLTDNR